MTAPNLEEKTRKAFRSVKHTGLGIELAVFLVVGVVGGNYLDERYGWAPWGILGGLAFGITGGVRAVMRTIKQMKRESDDEPPSVPGGENP